MRINELLPDSPLQGLKVKTKKGVVGYYFSQFAQGVFLSCVKNETNEGRLFPQVVHNFEDVQLWEVVGEDVGVNCDVLTQIQYIIN